MALLAIAGCSDGSRSSAVDEAVGAVSSAIVIGTGFQSTPWRYYGEKQGLSLGAYMRGVGDVNGDGYDDLAIGTQEWEPPAEDGFANYGRVQFFFGSKAGLPSTPSQTITGSGYSDRRADPIRAGDVNGDGYADVLIQGTLNYTGETGVYLYLGGAQGLNPEPVWHLPLEPGQPRVLGSPGDLNGDGRSDVMVSTRTYVTEWIPSIKFFAGTAEGLAPQPFQELGKWQSSASGVGDFNGDGRQDVVMAHQVVVAQNVTETEVTGHWGEPGGLKAGADWQFVTPTSKFSKETERLGDLNADGFADVGFSSASSAAIGYDGEAKVFLGGADPSTEPVWQATFPENNSGWLNMAGIGDANGDGYNEMLIGLDYFFNPHNGNQGSMYPPIGRARVHWGDPSGIEFSAGWSAYDAELNNNSFASVAVGAGDVNGDGFADIAIGDGFAEKTAALQSQGFVYVYYGSGGPEPVDRVLWNLEAREINTSEVLAAGARARSSNAFEIACVGLGTQGRTIVRLEAEVKPTTEALDGTELLHSEEWLDTGTSGVAFHLPALELDSNTSYQFRVRVVYRPDTAPLTRHSRWFSGPIVTTNCDDTDPDFDADGTCDDMDADDDNDGIDDLADCQPKNSQVAPGTPESADDGIDQDCSGYDTITCHVDADHDGFGSTTPILGEGSCSSAGMALGASDCDDTASDAYPGAPEVVGDGVDQDCDQKDAMLCYVDQDMDGYGSLAMTVPLGACQGASFAEVGGDCRDNDATSFPGAAEVVGDGIDQDCSGADGVSCFIDEDHDGYGLADEPQVHEGSCQTLGFSALSGDCDDDDAMAHPGAPEVVGDGLDQDCDGFDARMEVEPPPQPSENTGGRPADVDPGRAPLNPPIGMEGPPATPAAGAPGVAAAGSESASSGCGCRTAGGAGRSTRGILALLASVAGVVVARKRRAHR